MVTLNTLRTRGGVIVSIVIGIALLAFLLGDFSSAGNMMQSRKMRIHLRQQPDEFPQDACGRD